MNIFLFFSVEQFKSFGLSPIFPSSTGEYSEIEWAKLNGDKNYLFEWSKMVEGKKYEEIKDAQLDLPPLVLPQNYGSHVIIAFLKRGREWPYPNLEFHVGFHSNVSPNVTFCQVNIKVNIKLVNKIDKSIIELKQQNIVNIQHEIYEENRFKWYLNLGKLSWNELDKTCLPVGNISILQMDSSKYFYYIFILNLQILLII